MEENKVVAPAAAEQKPAEGQKSTRGPRQGYEPHGSQGAARPGDRKFGNHRGRPSERRGGRGGFRRQEPEYLERVVQINRVSKTTQGGKNVRFSALVVIGDGKGKYGFANSKSGEVPDAIKKSLEQAKKNMSYVNIVKGGTIAHDVVGKFGATTVVLKPAKPGTGIVAGGAVRAILELAGKPKSPRKEIKNNGYHSFHAFRPGRCEDQALHQRPWPRHRKRQDCR